MLRDRVLVATLAAILSVTVAAGSLVLTRTDPPSASPSRAPPTGIQYGLDTCHHYRVPQGAADLNRVAVFLRDPLAEGGDVAASTLLGDGRRVWLLGDTVRAADAGGLPVRNTMLVAASGCVSVVTTPTLGAVVPDRADGVGYWPMSLAAVRASGVTTLVVMSQRVRGIEAGFAFENLGPAVATFVIPDGGAPVFQGVTDIGADNPSRTAVGWGAAVTQGDDGWWYVFGTSNPELPLVFGWSVRVARARSHDLDEPGRWHYWTGSGWSTRPETAAEVVAAVGGVSQTFSVVSREGRWYAVSKRDGVFGTDLAVWSAAAPTGPYSPPVTVGRIANSPSPSVLLYMPLSHPDLPAAATSAVVVSVSRNSDDPALLARYPLLYRPFFLEVALPPVPSTADLRVPATS